MARNPATRTIPQRSLADIAVHARGLENDYLYHQGENGIISSGSETAVGMAFGLLAEALEILDAQAKAGKSSIEER